MNIARMSQARQKIRAICAGVPGFDLSRIQLGLVDVALGDNVFADLNSQPPLSITVAGPLATATFYDTPVFAVDQLVTIACPGIDTLASGMTGVQTVSAVDPDAKTISWVVPDGFNFVVEPAQEDLIFTTPFLVIKAAENSSTDCDSLISRTAVQVIMYFGFRADAAQSWIQYESLAFALRDALMNIDNWNSLCTGPTDISFTAPSVLRKDKPLTATYTFSLDFQGL